MIDDARAAKLEFPYWDWVSTAIAEFASHQRVSRRVADLTNRRRQNNRYIKIVEAFFPRYLFINLCSRTDNWAPIRSTLGVTQLLQFGGIPAVVPFDLVESLKSNEDEHGLIETQQIEIKAGDKVNIIDGPFAGYNGIYSKKQSNERVTILLDIVGKKSEVTISEHDLLLV